jgi:hypothetical protein
MRCHHKLRLGVLMLILFCLSVAASQVRGRGGDEKTDLALEVKSRKLVYQYGETVELNFILRNVGRKNVIVARRLRLTSNIGIEISDPQGQLAQWCGRIAEPIDSARSYMPLAPGESVRAILPVSCVNKEDRRRAWGFTLSSPGRYVVKAAYRLPRPKEHYENLFPNARVIRGPILAEPITIELK